MGKKLTKAQFNRIEELVDLFVQEALSDLTVEETHCSAMARNALIASRAASEGPGAA